MKRLIATLALAAVVLTALLAGSATTARAGTANHTQAVRKAKEYLSFEAFSLKGLIAQLKFEGFSTADATYGASHAGANWNKEAAKKAKSYLKLEAFSFSGLVQQLMFEKFTHAQAVYGAHAAGL